MSLKAYLLVPAASPISLSFRIDLGYFNMGYNPHTEEVFKVQRK